jgi:hypothetical protein
MSKYLDHDTLPNILERHYGDEKTRRARSVGAQRQFESAYFDFTRFFGSCAVAPNRIAISYQQAPFEFRDQRVKEFAAYVEKELRGEGRLYNGPAAMKLVSFEPRADEPVMQVQPANYGDKAGSCFGLDLRHRLFEPWGGTLRHYLLKSDCSHCLAKNPLAICLGVAGYLVISEPDGDYLLQVRRSKRLASLEDSFGPSVAGSIDWNTDARTLAELISLGMAGELREELGLKPEEYEVTPLGYAREILRGDRPQLFAMVRSKLSRAEVSKRLEGLPEDEREYSTFEFLPLVDGRLKFELIIQLNYEAQVCYYLLEEYLASQR